MKRSSALLVQVLVVFVGIVVLAFLLWEPHLEGRNRQATLFEIYFRDPFLAYVYLGSIPFFAGLYRAFGLFGQVRQSGAWSQGSVEALRGIARCATVLLGFVVGGAVLILVFGDKDDRPPGIFMSLLAVLGSSLMAIGAAGFARKVERALMPSGGGRG